MSKITTHVLDISRGRPAEGIEVALEQSAPGGWKLLALGMTDSDGRVKTLLPPEQPLARGTYRLNFALEGYFQKLSVDAFYPSAIVIFDVRSPEEHYHVPLLLSPFGYSTYRGS